MFTLKMTRGTELAEGVRAEMAMPEALTRFTIGRDPGNHWPIPDRTLAISARHCELVASGSRVLLRDLSTNGTFVNGSSTRLIGDHVLKDGDRIELGPYAIHVRGTGVHAGMVRDADVTVHIATTAPPPAPPVAAPLRGGDPAAMLAAGAPARVGLTEILRAAPPAEASDLAVTKIRLAPKAGSAGSAAAPAVPAPTLPVPLAATAPAPLPRAPSLAPVDPLVAQLAAAMGLPADALAGRDAAQAVAQVGALARAAVGALRLLMEQQAQSRRQVGSRAPALHAGREVNPLRLAATPEAALRLLLAPGADVQVPLQRAATELVAHQDRLSAAFRGAMARMGQEMAPAALEQALGGNDPEQLWALYTQVWAGLGLAPGQPWPIGFVEAAALHLATAYDDLGKAP
jgi:type VI secretion system FHA domain protein